MPHKVRKNCEPQILSRSEINGYEYILQTIEAVRINECDYKKGKVIKISLRFPIRNPGN